MKNKAWVLSAEQVKLVVLGYELGKSMESLAREFSITSDAIAGLLRRRGIKIRNNRVKLSEENKIMLLKLYKEGYGTTQLAKKFEVSQAWVWRYVSGNVGKTRGRIEINKLKRVHFFNESYFENIDSL